jgi:hypothetical protein
MLPVIIFVVIAVPLVVVGFFTVRRSRSAGEHPAGETEQARLRTEKEFEESERLQAEWRDEEREHQRDTLL